VPAEKVAHQSAEERKAAATSASAAPIVVAAAAAAVAARMAFGLFVSALKARDDLGKQGLVLETACRLPSPDHRAGLLHRLARGPTGGCPET